ncbi:MAG: D-glycero-beta-D-manno-heptose 1,7-bisphosphate 7-phosphatase [Desulfuromonadales bacterium]|nr:D-glycero-beta-D-manno-heptose 1,7-bisphosphate 7-phosphatase [Desulfuromonadales bacterium]
MTPEEKPPNGLRRAVFLDRDGTINLEKDYLYEIDDFDFIFGAEIAIKKLKDAGFLVVVVTNQSGIGRGYYTERDVLHLHRHIQLQLQKENTSIDAFYYCPHHPEKGIGDYRQDCQCRKGQPGMLLQAASEHGIDLESSFMVGDKRADIEAGQNAGCTPLLVLTGYGQQAAKDTALADVLKFDDLAKAAAAIIENSSLAPL